MKQITKPTFFTLIFTISLIFAVGCKRELTPMEKMFSSVESVRLNLTGTCFASEDNSCLIDFRRESRYKVFVKKNGEWRQFNGQRYFITYSSDNSVCVECSYMESYGTDKFAEGILTPKYFELKEKNGTPKQFKNMRIITNSEAKSIYEGQ